MNTNPFLFLIFLCLLAMIWILRMAMLRVHFGRWQFPEGARKPVWEISSSFLYAQLKKIHRRWGLVRVE